MQQDRELSGGTEPSLDAIRKLFEALWTLCSLLMATSTLDRQEDRRGVIRIVEYLLVGRD
jgi:hypothetical protein